MAPDWQAWRDRIAATEPTPTLAAACARIGRVLATAQPMTPAGKARPLAVIDSAPVL